MSNRWFLPSRQNICLLAALVLLALVFGASPSISYGQTDSPVIPSGQALVPPNYPGISPAKPLFDLPLIAPSMWPNQLRSYNGTCQAPLRPMRNCTYFKLVYANSINLEPYKVALNPITLRASLVILRPGKPASIRQVTFNGGNVEVTLAPETAIVSDKIPEYWNVSENAKAYVRTFVRLPSSTAFTPCYNSIQPLTGEYAKWVTNSTTPPDLTMAAWNAPAFVSAPAHPSPYYPVAVIGDAAPTSPSVAIVGSSSSAYLHSAVPTALNRLGIPYIILSTVAWSAKQYEASVLRTRVDASCSHIIEQFGRNDLGETYNSAYGVAYYLDPIKASLLRIWQRHKMQGSWVAQATLQPHVYPAAPYTDPMYSKPYAVEQPLRQPLNAWIRLQPQAVNSPLNYVYEVGDTVEYWENNQRTNRWDYNLLPDGSRIGLTSDGLHPNTNGIARLCSLFTAGQFAYDSRDWVPPCLASAIVPAAGTTVVLTFNEAKTPPLRGLLANSRFSITVNSIPRTLSSMVQTGPKEITLKVSGTPIRKTDQVHVSYEAQDSYPITDSSTLRNKLPSFSGEAIWNNSAL